LKRQLKQAKQNLSGSESARHMAPVQLEKRPLGEMGKKKEPWRSGMLVDTLGVPGESRVRHPHHLPHVSGVRVSVLCENVTEKGVKDSKCGS